MGFTGHFAPLRPYLVRREHGEPPSAEGMSSLVQRTLESKSRAAQNLPSSRSFEIVQSNQRKCRDSWRNQP
jgi:hypothetical protein